MIEDAKSRLNTGTYTIADGIHYDGASSAAYFIEKIAPLHPEHINAYSFGANGHAFLPFENLTDDIPVHGDPDRTTIPWPIGTGNFEELTGEEFNKEAWMDIEQFRWIGGEDQDPDDPENHIHTRFTDDHREISQVVEEIFGTLQVDDRFETSRDIYDHLDVPARFRIFEGQPHAPDFEYMLEPVDFHKEQIEKDFELIHLSIQETKLRPRGAYVDSEAQVGDTVTVSVAAKNLTDVESSTTISFAVNGTEVETTDMQVDSKSTETVELETTFDQTGEFTLSVNGTTVEDQVVVTEETPGFGIVQTLAAVGGVGYLINRRLSNND